MPRYWVIAPVESKPAELYDKVWKFDLDNNLISIGWSEIGDVSKLSREAIADAVATAFPDRPQATIALITNMFWAFYHEIAPGDIILARRGRKILAGVGKVLAPAEYAPAKNPYLASGYTHTNFLSVQWQPEPRDVPYSGVVFPMHTLAELSEDKFRNLVEQPTDRPAPVTTPATSDPTTFALEKYLEEFIVSNFASIFKGKLTVYEDQEVNEGQQYQTDIGPIDILAVETTSNAFVVIELKKGRTSDQVVGQILRYMGWVKKNLCTEGQPVKGLVICGEPDPKLSYALAMTSGIDLRYYNVSFSLTEPASL